MRGDQSADRVVELGACVAIACDLEFEASVARLGARSARRFGELLVELVAEKGGVSKLSEKDLYGLGLKRKRDRAMRIASIPADQFPRRACAPGVDDRHWRGGGRSGRGREVVRRASADDVAAYWQTYHRIA